MARIFQASFENTSVTANPAFFDTVTNVVNGTTHPRTGSRAAQITSLASGTPRGADKKYQNAAQTSDFFRVYIYIVTLPSAANSIIQVSASTSLGSTLRATIKLNSDGTLTLFGAGGLQIGSASSALSVNTWYCVEIHTDTINATGSRTIAARLAPDDGTTPSVFATSSAETMGTCSSFVIGGNLGSEAQTTGEWWFDDIAINNSAAGGTQTSYPGQGNVWEGWPTGAGDVNTFATQTGGTAGSGNNYTRVNEKPPDDATTLNGSNTLNQEDLFVMDVSGVPATATINTVAVGGRVRNNTADAVTALKFELEKAASGTIAQSSAVIPNTTGFNSLDISSPRNYLLMLYQDPDAVNWNPATWAPQAGYKITTGGTNRVEVTNLWISVDYTPAVAATATPRLRSLLGVGL